MTINVEPVGKGRPRAVNRGGFVSMYTPKRSREFEGVIEDAARELFEDQDPISCPVSVHVLAAFKRPKSKQRRKDPEGLIPKITKPDGDNVLKSILDALVSAGVLVDDAIVVDARIVKAHAGKGDPPRVVIWIREVAELPSVAP